MSKPAVVYFFAAVGSLADRVYKYHALAARPSGVINELAVARELKKDFTNKTGNAGAYKPRKHKRLLLRFASYWCETVHHRRSLLEKSTIL